MFAKVSLVPVSARQPGPRERVFRGRLRADREGKRARPTRRKRLREGREATASERRAPGNRSGERRGNASTAPSRRFAGGHGRWSNRIDRPREHPNCALGEKMRWRQGVWHGQPGQRERRQSCEPGSPGAWLDSVSETRATEPSGRGAPFSGSPGWRQAAASRVRPVIGPQTGIARHAFGHDGRCEVERRLTPEDRPVVDRPTFRVAPGGCAGASRPHRPGLFTVFGPVRNVSGTIRSHRRPESALPDGAWTIRHVRLSGLPGASVSPVMAEPDRSLSPGMQEQLGLGYVFGGICDVRTAAVPDRPRTARRLAARRGDRRRPVRHRHHQPPRRSLRTAGDPFPGLRARHLPPRPRDRDLRPPRGRRLRRRLLPARPDRGQPRQHPRPRVRDRLARDRADHPRRRPLDHLAGRHRRRRRARLRQRRHRPLRRPRRHRRHHRRQPRQPRHADAAPDRVGRRARRPLRAGRPARLLAAGRDRSPGCASRAWCGTRCRRSGIAASRT